MFRTGLQTPSGDVGCFLKYLTINLFCDNIVLWLFATFFQQEEKDMSSLKKIWTWVVVDLLGIRPVVGIIENVQFGMKMLGTVPVTTFNVRSDNGKIYHLGINGHHGVFYEGKRVEIYPSGEHAARENVTDTHETRDGTVTLSEKTIIYYTFSKYKSLPGVVVANGDESRGFETDI
jgi:hypothetical protein